MKIWICHRGTSDSYTGRGNWLLAKVFDSEAKAKEWAKSHPLNWIKETTVE